MVRYEFSLIFAALKNEALAASIKDTVSNILGRGNVVRNITSLGERPLPIKMKDNAGKGHENGSYILMDVDCPEEEIPNISRYLKDYQSILRFSFIEYEHLYKDAACEGWETVDYGALLEKSRKRQQYKKYQTQLYPKNWMN